MIEDYQAILVVSFGGPEGPDEVIPFLENVLRGRDVPRQRLLEVAEHYRHFGGVSPINAQNRALIAALRAELEAHGPRLPIYWGNRNWRPFLPDTLRQMAGAGIQRALAYCTSAFSSYSGCRQYLENIAAARSQLGTSAPRIDKLRIFYNHPGFIAALADRVRDALDQVPSDQCDGLECLFTAHSIPLTMAAGCDYQRQLLEASRLVAAATGLASWRLVYQSRSGPPGQKWLEPDLADALAEAAAQGTRHVLLVPIGFLSDHMEVRYDLDVEARQLATRLGLQLTRAGTVGTHPRFIRMIRELIVERIDPASPRLALGASGPRPDNCPGDCCPSGRMPP